MIRYNVIVVIIVITRHKTIDVLPIQHLVVHDN